MVTASQIRTFFKLASRYAINRPKGWKALLYNSSMARLRKAGPLMMPVHVSIEPANTCNAACPVCETGKQEMNRAKGKLDPAAFYKFIDEIHPTTSCLLFYFMGEPFLNKHSYDMIRYARSKGIYVETCTNGDLVDAKGVIHSDINQISFQLGGLTQEIHGRYRVNSDIERVKKNLYELIEEKKKNPLSNVKIEVGFIVMRHNEHQINDFLKWAQEIGVDKANVIDPVVRNMFEAHAYLPKDKKYWFYDEDAFEKGFLKPKQVLKNECIWIWNSIQLNWNGDAVPCCRDPLGKFILGNVFEDGLKNLWNGKKATDFRKRILTSQRGTSICNLCSGYGIPELQKDSDKEFKIQRHTVNE